MKDVDNCFLKKLEQVGEKKLKPRLKFKLDTNPIKYLITNCYKSHFLKIKYIKWMP